MQSRLRFNDLPRDGGGISPADARLPNSTVAVGEFGSEQVRGSANGSRTRVGSVI